MRQSLTGRPLVDYQRIHDNFRHPAHVQRLFVTAGLLSSLGPSSVCDPACGDASIVKVANTMRPIAWGLLGDISAPAIEHVADGLGEMACVAYNGDIAACIEAIAGIGFEGYANLETGAPSGNWESDLERNLDYLRGLK